MSANGFHEEDDGFEEPLLGSPQQAPSFSVCRSPMVAPGTPMRPGHPRMKPPKPQKLAFTVAGLGAALLLDAPLAALFATAIFSSNMRNYLGLEDSTYPAGSAGLDLILLSCVRIIWTAGSLVAHNLELRTWSLKDALGIPKQRHTWASYVATAGGWLSLLWLVAKCLTRLIDGTNAPAGGLPLGWFWAAVCWSGAIAVVEWVLIEEGLKQSLVYWTRYKSSRNYRGYVGDTWEALLEDGQGSGSYKFKAGWGDLLTLVQPDWALLSVAFTALTLAAVGQVLIPTFVGDMIDNVVTTKDRAKFYKSTSYLIYAAIGTAVFTGIRGGILTVVGGRANVRIRSMLYESLMKQEIGFFDTTKTGDITSRLSADTTKVGDQVSMNVNVFLRNFVQVMGTLIFMMYLSWNLCVVAFVSVPGIVIVSKYYGSYVRDLAKRAQDQLAECNTVAEETLSTMTTVRSFAAEDKEVLEYKRGLADFLKLVVLEAKAYTFYATFNTLLPQLVTALVLFYGGRLVIAGELSSGKVVSFMLYMATLSDGFNNMGQVFSAMTQAVGAADKVFELIRREPKSRKPSRSPDDRTLCKGEVVLKGVSFTYPARPGRVVLNDMNFTIKAGQVLALVGPSGGGKSSCISLLQRFYHPDEGSVSLDGVPVEDYHPRWFHRQVSIVGQEPVLYARSIRKNIIYGLEGDADEPSFERVVEAAKLANAHDFICALPDGYDTEVGERGVQMSGGQKQRIAIARALVRQPKVLLLDEATSALDATSEHAVQEAIDRMMNLSNLTVAIIAHRLSTVKHADCIVVVAGGQVVEYGRHQELVMKRGVYADLVARQLAVTEHDLAQQVPTSGIAG